MIKRLLILVAPVLILTACPNLDPTVKTGRDVAAAAQGAIVAAQAQCSTNPAAKACSILPQAIAAQNFLVTSLETACGWSPTAPPADPSAKCVTVSGALPALSVATSNANALLTELNGALGK